jgi:hypothetical protein
MPSARDGSSRRERVQEDSRLFQIFPVFLAQRENKYSCFVAPQPFSFPPLNNDVPMDTEALYATFTHPKVVTSMLLIGIGLGLALSVLMSLFWGAWYLPVTLVAVCLGTVLLYMVWLDRQDFRDE